MVATLIAAAVRPKLQHAAQALGVACLLTCVLSGCRSGVHAESTRATAQASDTRLLQPTRTGGGTSKPAREAPARIVASARGAGGPLLVLHGYGSSGAGHLQFFGLPNAHSERAQVEIIAPNGLRDRVNDARFWNAVPSCCDFEQTAPDDVAYLSEFLPAESTGAPTAGIIGHSNGGAMALRMACEVAPRVARVAVLAPAFFGDQASCKPARPVGVLIVHGERDRVVPYAGGPLKRIHPNASAAVSLGALAIADHFASVNGCTGSSIGEPLDLDAAASRDGDSREAEHRHYEGCRAPVELYSLAGVGHALSRQTVQYTDIMTQFALGSPTP